MGYLIRRTYSKVDSKGKRIKRTSKRWYCRFRDENDRIITKLGFTDKEASRQLLAKLEKEIALAKAGVVDPFKQHRKIPLAEHLAAFEQSLRDQDRSREHVSLVVGRVRRIVEASGFAFVQDIAATKVEQYLAQRRAQGLSRQGSNHHIRAIRQFVFWMKREQRLGIDPLVGLRTLNVATDRRLERRAFTEEEFRLLLGAAQDARPFMGLSGPTRVALYAVAAGTGLRAKELASLTRSNFDLDVPMPSVRVFAKAAKAKREDVIPLHLALVETLRPILNAQKAAQRLWPGNWYSKAAKMIRRDLKAAGIAVKDETGKVLDFHGLRTTFISRLATSQVPAKVVQRLARHASITTTMNTYAKLTNEDLHHAVLSVPMMAAEKLAPGLALEAGKSAVEGATTGNNAFDSVIDMSSYNRRKNTGFCNDSSTAPGAIRTHDLRFRKCRNRIRNFLSRR